MYVPANLMYLSDIGCHESHSERVLALYYSYDCCSPKPCDPPLGHSYILFQMRKVYLNSMFSSNVCTISDSNMVSSTEV